MNNTTVDEATAIVIGRCASQGCTNRRRNTIDTVVRHQTEGGPILETQIPAGVHGYDVVRPMFGSYTRPSVHATGGDYHRAYLHAMTAQGWVCATHDRYMTLEWIDGITNPGVVCSGSCTHAFGGTCECSCGGAQHGKKWDAPATDALFTTGGAA